MRAAATRVQRRFCHPVPLSTSHTHPSPLQPSLTSPPPLPPSPPQCDAPMLGRHRGPSGTINARTASSPARCEDREDRSCTESICREDASWSGMIQQTKRDLCMRKRDLELYVWEETYMCETTPRLYIQKETYTFGKRPGCIMEIHL